MWFIKCELPNFKLSIEWGLTIYLLIIQIVNPHSMIQLHKMSYTKIIYIKLLKLESSFEVNYAQVLEDDSFHNPIMFFF